MLCSIRSIVAAIADGLALIIVSGLQCIESGAVRFVQCIADIPSTWRQNRNRGALVSRIGMGSPAEKAGIEIGDIIICFAGIKVRNSAQLRILVATCPRNAASVEVMRKGRRKSFIVTISAASPKQSSIE